MAILKGIEGHFNVGVNAVAEMNNWSLDVSSEFVDTTEFGDTTRGQMPTFMTWSGSAAGKLDLADTNGQVVLQAATLGQTTVDARFYVSSASYYHGDAYVSFSISAAVDNLVEGTYTFSPASALTYHAS